MLGCQGALLCVCLTLCIFNRITMLSPTIPYYTVQSAMIYVSPMIEHQSAKNPSTLLKSVAISGKNICNTYPEIKIVLISQSALFNMTFK